MSELLLECLLAVVAMMVLVWLGSLLTGRVCIIDAFWGPGFAVVSVLCMFRRADQWAGPWPYLLVGMVSVWALRLALHLGIRIAHETKEDRRYQAMRDKYNPGFWWKSLGIVFLLQGIIMWIVALPLMTAFHQPQNGTNPVLFAVSGLIWLTGLFFEGVGDWQLTRFRANPSNHGRVLSTGLWKYTRHPNYFGDFLVWWGHWGCAFLLGAPLWTILSPILMSVFLMKVSGVGLLEKDIAERRPDYMAYQTATNTFFPWFPQK